MPLRGDGLRGCSPRPRKNHERRADRLRWPGQSGGCHESPENPPSNREASGPEKRNRSDLKEKERGEDGDRVIVVTAEWWSTRILRDHGDCGLRSFVMAHRGGGDRTMRRPSSQGRAPWTPGRGFEVGVTARSGKVQDRLLPPAHLPSELGVSIKAAAIIYFGGVWAHLISRIVKCFSLYIICIAYSDNSALCLPAHCK